MSDATNYFDLPRQGYAVSQTEVRALRERIAELEARLVMAEGYMSKAALRRFRKALGGDDVSETD